MLSFCHTSSHAHQIAHQQLLVCALCAVKDADEPTFTLPELEAALAAVGVVLTLEVVGLQEPTEWCSPAPHGLGPSECVCVDCMLFWQQEDEMEKRRAVWLATQKVLPRGIWKNMWHAVTRRCGAALHARTCRGTWPSMVVRVSPSMILHLSTRYSEMGTWVERLATSGHQRYLHASWCTYVKL